MLCLTVVFLSAPCVSQNVRSGVCAGITAADLSAPLDVSLLALLYHRLSKQCGLLLLVTLVRVISLCCSGFSESGITISHEIATIPHCLGAFSVVFQRGRFKEIYNLSADLKATVLCVLKTDCGRRIQSCRAAERVGR